MGHTRSVRKRARATLRINSRNRSIRSRCKTYVAKAEKAISDNDFSLAEEAVKQAISILDKTAKKGGIHPNNTARRKSNLVKKLNAARATSPDTED